MKSYQFFAHISSDIGRFFKSRALKILEQEKKMGNAFASYELGEMHIMNGETRDAVKCWHFAAQRGVVEAQFILGRAYFYGNFDLPVDYINSLHWLEKITYRKSIESYRKFQAHHVWMANVEDYDEYNEVFLRLAKFYIEKIKDKIAPNSALLSVNNLKQLRKSALSGDSESQYLLGVSFAKGFRSEKKFIRPNYEWATKYWRLAAEQGHVGAQLSLAYVLWTGAFKEPFRGKAIAQDGAEGKRWWQVAAEAGHLGAQRELGFLLCDYAQNLHVATLPNRRFLVRGWQPIGKAGEYVEEGLHWLKKAATNGDFDSQMALGTIFGDGMGVDQDEASAFRWYEMAAENDEEGRATLALANCYINGMGTDVNAAEARRLLKAAQYLHGNKFNNLVRICESTTADHKDHLHTKIEIYSAESGRNISAMSRLAGAYLRGEGVAQDGAEAMRWHRRYNAEV